MLPVIVESLEKTTELLFAVKVPAFDQLPAIVIVYASVVFAPAASVAPLAIDTLVIAVLPLSVVVPLDTVSAPILSVPVVTAVFTVPVILSGVALYVAAVSVRPLPPLSVNTAVPDDVREREDIAEAVEPLCVIEPPAVAVILSLGPVYEPKLSA